jgi:predicted GIY-YIG superfamily endonuclease
MNRNQKIFVVGTARSGTTYLARSLALPREVAYWEESYLLGMYGARRFPVEMKKLAPQSYPGKFLNSNYYMGMADRIRRKDRLRNCLSDMILNSKIRPFDLTPSGLLIEVQKLKLDSSDAQFLDELISKYRHGSLHQLCGIMDEFVTLTGKDIVVEKTPSHLNYVPHLLSLFPDSKVVCIVRNEKDSLASYIKNFTVRNSLRNHFRTENQKLRDFAKRCTCERSIKHWVERQKNCLIVQYEDFLQNPYEEVKRVYGWADIDIDIQEYEHMFSSKKPTSNWERLSVSQKNMATALLQ